MCLSAHQLTACMVICLLWASPYHAQVPSPCIDDRDCTNDGHICIRGSCLPWSHLRCPDVLVRPPGEEILVSHLRRVTIKPPNATCGQDNVSHILDDTWSCGTEETVCHDRHPRDQNLLYRLDERVLVGSQPCPTDSVQSSGTVARCSNCTGDMPLTTGGHWPPCQLTIGENMTGPTVNSTFAVRLLLGSTK